MAKVLGEVAHIENVLKGEFKERIHRRAKTTEETFFQEVETTETAERDLESTERFELQLESQQVINEETSKEAGVTVTAKYGTLAGSVEATAYGNYASDRAKEQSKRSASSYSRDVTERSVSRIQERVLERRSRRTVQEVEETNTHRLKNDVDPDGHIVGIYRWVDKIYKAQLLNYGKRMMFEFIVPEPAAFFRYAQSANPLEGTTLEKPDPPGYCVTVYGSPSCAGASFYPLTPEDIAPENYLYWVSKYEVPNVEPPPPQYKVIATAFEQKFTKSDPDPVANSSKDIKVPPGYLAKNTWFKGNFVHYSPLRVNVYLGRKDVSNFNFIYPLDNEDDVVPLAVVGQDILSYAFTVEILCELSQEKLEEWQMDTYNAIMTAYNEKKAEYDEQIAAAEIQEGVDIQGRNPLRNREIERTELKKATISGISGQHFDLFDSMRNMSSQGYPQINFAEAEVEGRYIQFFEQAFEWENMTYLFYPYFWGRKDEWPAISSLDDADPLFAQFLRAGAAQVQVPVNIGYEEAVCHFIETGGDIWMEGDPPHIEDEFCMSLVEEMRQEETNQLNENKGRLIVEQGSRVVIGVNTEFTEDDIDREITILGEKYRIEDVINYINFGGSNVAPGDKMDELTLTENYRGESMENVRYSLGVKFVGEPWEVKIPTSLVFLQPLKEDTTIELPDWTQPEEEITTNMGNESNLM